MHAVGGVAGLLLQVSPTGARSWILRVWIGTKRRNIGLGGYPDVTLAQAREKARDMRAAVSDGRDPLAERVAARAALKASQARMLTFSEAVEKSLPDLTRGVSNPKAAAQWQSTLSTYAIPIIGDMQVADIDVQDIVRVLKPIWETKTETASRLRGRIERVLAWATTNKHREGVNPALWRKNLDTILTSPSSIREVEHHPAVQMKDTGSWFADVQSRGGQRAEALRLLAMTCVRSENIREMRWPNIDCDARVWTIPKEDMKGQKNQRKEHKVPLTDEMIELLSRQPRAENCDLVFPSSRGTPLSDATISSCMRAVHEAKKAEDSFGYLDRQSLRPAVPHGLRSTFRDWTAERGIDRDMAEIALAHVVRDEVERAYRRTDLLERRRVLMAAWVAFLKGDEDEETARLGECR